MKLVTSGIDRDQNLIISNYCTTIYTATINSIPIRNSSSAYSRQKIKCPTIYQA